MILQIFINVIFLLKDGCEGNVKKRSIQFEQNMLAQVLNVKKRSIQIEQNRLKQVQNEHKSPALTQTDYHGFVSMLMHNTVYGLRGKLTLLHLAVFSN